MLLVMTDVRSPIKRPSVSLGASPGRVCFDVCVTDCDGKETVAVYADISPADARRLAGELVAMSEISEVGGREMDRGSYAARLRDAINNPDQWADVLGKLDNTPRNEL